MARFIVRRLLLMIPLIIGITFITFCAMALVPGNFVSNLAMDPRIPEAVIKQMEAQFGLDQPLLVRYGRWLWAVLHLDFGISLQYRTNVTFLIASRAFNTVLLSLASMLLSWLLAIPIGVIVAMRQNSIVDRILSVACFLGMSVPAFFLAFLAMDFALRTGWFPVGGTFSPDYASLDTWSKVADRINHLVLPAAVLGLAGMA